MKMDKIKQIIREAIEQANKDPVNNTNMNGHKILVQLAKNIILQKVLEQKIIDMTEESQDNTDPYDILLELQHGINKMVNVNTHEKK